MCIVKKNLFIMEKPHTRLEDCLKFLLWCFRERMPSPEPLSVASFLLVVAAFSAEYADAAGIWTTLDLQGDSAILTDCIYYVGFYSFI